MPRPTLPRLNPYAHPQSRIDFYISRVYPPIISLADRIGRFDGPFAALRDENYGFCSATRFHLNHCVAGDPLALQAAEFVRRFERMRILNERHPILTTTPDPRRQFFETRWNEYSAFRERHFPWELAQIVLGPYPFAAQLTTLIDLLLREHLPDSGFVLKRKGMTPTWKANVSGYVLELEAEIHWRAAGIHFRLGVPHVGITDTLGYPFFYSSSTLPVLPPDALVAPLSRFFTAYAHVFSHVRAAIQEGLSVLEVAWEEVRRGSHRA